MLCQSALSRFRVSNFLGLELSFGNSGVQGLGFKGLGFKGLGLRVYGLRVPEPDWDFTPPKLENTKLELTHQNPED